MTIELLLIGIGTGNPNHVTAEAAQHLKRADVIMVPRKGSSKSDLADLRHQICDAILGDDSPPLVEFDLPVRNADKAYIDGVDEWHDAIAIVWQKTIEDARHHLGSPPKTAALLIWGDPGLYDSSLRIAARLNPKPNIVVVPGITSIQALTAAHRIPLNTLGAPFIITTGRRLRDEGFPRDVDTAIIMLDGECSFTSLNGDDFDIWWGAYLGMNNQILCAGHLSDVSDQILSMRKTARANHGWIMDCYLLRRR